MRVNELGSSAASGTSITVALVGNPNVGKSTLFSVLTGLNQHVGNWPGKTVEVAEGFWKVNGRVIKVIDLPGVYSLQAITQEEALTRDYILSKRPQVVVMVVDATNLERNLYLAFQVMELTQEVVIALNMMDMARKSSIEIDSQKLSQLLGVPVVPMSAIKREGVDALWQTVVSRSTREGVSRVSWTALPECLERDSDGPKAAHAIYARVAEVVKHAVRRSPGTRDFSQKLDDVITSKIFAFPIMLAVVTGILWLTIFGAAPFTDALSKFFGLSAEWLRGFLDSIWVPTWIRDPIVDGLVVGVGAVVSVMLPTMSLFFVLFAVLEDSGLIPRIAFILDRPFQLIGSQGKHSITCLMGYGCNVPGVTACRILKGRDRAIAVLTNSLIPCNGRLGVILPLSLLFFGAQGIWVALSIFTVSLVAVGLTTLFLTRVVFKTGTSEFIIEMPRYKLPQLGRIALATLRQKVLNVLFRACLIAAPITLLIWFLSNYPEGSSGGTFSARLANFLHPIGSTLGLDGNALVALAYAVPAKEIVIGALAITSGFSTNLKASGLIEGFLVSNWTRLEAFNFLLFYSLYMPCVFTAITIYKELGSKKLGLLGLLIPFGLAFGLTSLANVLGQFFGLD